MPSTLRPLESSDVAALWNALADRYGTRVVSKPASPLMRASGRGLGMLGIMTPETFMTRYTTVIYRRIYVPYTPGDAAGQRQLWGQASTAVHEHQHVEQANDAGFFRFATRYLTSSRWRADYEAEAYGGDIEFMAWAGQTPRSARALADGLAAYNVSPAGIDRAFATLQRYERSAALGVIQNTVTRWAITWLEARLRGPHR